MNESAFRKNTPDRCGLNGSTTCQREYTHGAARSKLKLAARACVRRTSGRPACDAPPRASSVGLLRAPYASGGIRQAGSRQNRNGRRTANQPTNKQTNANGTTWTAPAEPAACDRPGRTQKAKTNKQTNKQTHKRAAPTAGRRRFACLTHASSMPLGGMPCRAAIVERSPVFVDAAHVPVHSTGTHGVLDGTVGVLYGTTRGAHQARQALHPPPLMPTRAWAVLPPRLSASAKQTRKPADAVAAGMEGWEDATPLRRRPATETRAVVSPPNRPCSGRWLPSHAVGSAGGCCARMRSRVSCTRQGGAPLIVPPPNAPSSRVLSCECPPEPKITPELNDCEPEREALSAAARPNALSARKADGSAQRSKNIKTCMNTPPPP